MGDGKITKKEHFWKTKTVCHLVKAGSDNQPYFIKSKWKRTSLLMLCSHNPKSMNDSIPKTLFFLSETRVSNTG